MSNDYAPFQVSILLDKDFTMTLQKLIEKYGTKFAKINGLADSQLSFTDFLANFVKTKNVNDVSIDANANRSHKDIVALEREMNSPHSKLIALNKIFQELKDKYGIRVAKQWLEGEWNGETYLHDASSSTWRPYCYSYDLGRLVKEGLFFIENFNSLPPKHLGSYTDFVSEYVSWNCNRTSGAVGIADFLIYHYYFWKKDKEEGYLGIVDWDKYRDQEFQRIIYRLNQPFLRQGIESAFTNISIFDREYLFSIFGGKTYPDGTPVVDFIEEIREYQKSFMNVVAKIRSTNMMTFPILTFSLLKIKKQWKDEEFARWACEHNRTWGDSNFFVSDTIDSLASCCRLKNNVADLGFFSSISGSALEVGSVKVNTINLARIALEVKDNNQEEFFKILEERVCRVIKALDVVRSIITKNHLKGLLPNYKEGLISLEKQYNTIGITAFEEACELMGMISIDKLGNHSYTKDGKVFASHILDEINRVKTEQISKLKLNYMINVEQVPGEQAALKSMLKDLDIYDGRVEDLKRNLYGNQWIPLAVKSTLKHRVEMAALLDAKCGGGAILHCNIEKPFANFETAWEMLNYITDKGVGFFAYNYKISACAKNHAFFGEVCPECGGSRQTYYTRIVGFLTAVKNWSSPRQEEFDDREFYKGE